MTMDANIIFWGLAIFSVICLLAKMTSNRNNALRLLAWIIVIFVINGTAFGRVVDITISEVATEFGTQLNETQLVVWAFAVNTAFCLLLAKVFVAIWGTQKVDTHAVGLGAVERALQK